jgi:hypothetical protein
MEGERYMTWCRHPSEGWGVQFWSLICEYGPVDAIQGSSKWLWREIFFYVVSFAYLDSNLGWGGGWWAIIPWFRNQVDLDFYLDSIWFGDLKWYYWYMVQHIRFIIASSLSYHIAPPRCVFKKLRDPSHHTPRKSYMPILSLSSVLSNQGNLWFYT